MPKQKKVQAIPLSLAKPPGYHRPDTLSLELTHPVSCKLLAAGILVPSDTPISIPGLGSLSLSKKISVYLCQSSAKVNDAFSGIQATHPAPALF
ncbi:hypothetical protein HDU81_001736, partial [Chytriomyces hyalinus]